MNFIYAPWIFPIIFIVSIICYMFWRQEKRFNQWVKDHWFFDQSACSKWAFVFFSCGIFLLSLSMADLRGPSQKIKTKIPLQRTAILLDVSLSMLAEDVRPNRLEKAIQIAKHFVKKAAGHSISLMIFSDRHKQLVPFTEDIDLLEARLGSLKKLDLNRGGSSIKKAIQETLGYLIEKSATKKKPHGNIVIISDSDETFPAFELRIPDSITMAYIAVGTAKGGRIPLRTKGGILGGYKKYKKKEVISKINELELKKLGSKIKNFYYWVLSSYSIPTEEILLYLRKAHHIKFIESENVIRPVLMGYLVVPGLILLIFSFLLRIAPRYTTSVLLFIFMAQASYVYATSDDLKSEKSPDKRPFEDDLLYLKFKAGKANKKERLKIAEKYLKSGGVDKALQIYEENLSLPERERREYQAPMINYGTALMKSGHLRKGINLLNNYKELVQDEKIKKVINENILALLKQEKKKNQQQEQKKQGDKKEKGGGRSNDPQKNKKDEKKKDGQSSSSPKPEQGNPRNDDKGNQKKKKRKKVKLPTLLKQLVDKDKKLQEKMLDTKTKSKNASQQKDW